MRSPWLRRALMGVGFIGAGVLVAAPVPALLEARDAAAEADLAASTDLVRPLALDTSETEGVRTLVSAPDEFSDDLFTIRRIAEPLVPPVRERRVHATSGSIVADYPEPACLVMRVDGHTTVSVGTDEPLIPASVQKVLTAMAVLDIIGPDERFHTWAAATAVADENGRVDGHLMVTGEGDPMMAERRYADSYRRQPQLLTDISELAADIAFGGTTRYTGDLIVDDRRYDTVRYVESWPARYFEQHNSGPIGALTVNDGFTQWDPVRVEAADPAVYFGQILARELAAVGVTFGGRVVRADRHSAVVGENAGEVSWVNVGSIESAPVGEIVQQMLRESDNNTAESLLKELGVRTEGEGSTAAGARAVVAAAEARGIDPASIVVMDGSGLDRGNLITCDALASVLDQFGPDSIIGEGMAVAAESGTLGHRFADTPVAGRLHAKTGLLNNVNGLAGFVETLDGNWVTFAQLLNGIPLNSRLGIELQEDLAAQLVQVEVGPQVEEIERDARLNSR